jgi:hypothetical protein
MRRNREVRSDVNARRATGVGPNGNAPSDVEEALRAAVVLAVRAGEYARAAEVLELLRVGDP